MADHYIMQQAQAELMRKGGMKMSHEEYASVEPIAGDESSYQCKLCSDRRKKTKRHAIDHYSKCHGKSRDTVKTWIVWKDGQALRNKRGCRCCMTACYRQHQAEELIGAAGAADPWSALTEAVAAMIAEPLPGEDDFEVPPLVPDRDAEDDGPAAAACDEMPDENDDPAASEWKHVAPKPKMLPKPSNCPGAAPAVAAVEPAAVLSPESQVAKELAEQVKGLREVMRGKRAEQVKVRINDACRAWEPKETTLRRKTVPIDASGINVREDFTHWLRQQRNLKQKTITPAIANLRRFFKLLDIEEGHTPDEAGVLVALYEDNLWTEMLETKIMSPVWSWTRKIVGALVHWCNFMVMDCERKGQWGTKESITALGHLLIGWTKQCSKEHKTHNRARYRFDADRIANMADDTVLKEAVRQAMIDLQRLAAECRGRARLPAGVLGRANVIIVGIIWLNGWAGRSGEWQEMESADVREQLAKGLDYLICPNHKTSDEYGEAVKHLSPGTLEAVKVYLELTATPREKSSPLFLQPVKGDHVSISSCLRQFGKRRLPDTQPPAVNLVRKKFHEAAITSFAPTETLEMLKQVDKHSVEVAHKTYSTLQFGKEARMCAAVFVAVMGEPVEWPTELAMLEDAPGSAPGLNAIELEEQGSESESSSSSDGDLAESLGDVMRRLGHTLPSAAAAASPIAAAATPSAAATAPAAAAAATLSDADQPRRGGGSDAGAADAGAPQKRRRTLLSPEQKQWIFDENKQFMGGMLAVAYTAYYDDLLAQGIRAGILTVNNTAAALRSHIRAEVQNAKRGGV